MNDTRTPVSIPLLQQSRQWRGYILALLGLLLAACIPVAMPEPTAEQAVSGQSVAPAPDEEPVRGQSAASLDPATFALTLTPLVDGLTRPIFVTHASDGSGRLFIVEQPGTIRIYQDSSLLPNPFLDISDQVNDGGNEQGLLGLAFAPNYPESGFFVVNYTDLNGNTTIARFQVSAEDANRADPTSEFTILHLAQPARNHNGGMLLFGPDGHLWIGMGDGGGSGDRFGHGQNPDTLLGKMLRLDVTSEPTQPYTIPADNPWVNTAWNGADVRDEVWAIGLRNPWRYSFDRTTGDLWIGDVGQNVYEEVNYTPAAALAAGNLLAQNFGWPIVEGNHCFQSTSCEQSEFTPPAAEYSHSGHCSVTGGYVYRGAHFPALHGVYFYADYCSGVIWALTPSAESGWQSHEIMRSGMNISSFGEDEEGELYVVDLRGGVYRLGVE